MFKGSYYCVPRVGGGDPDIERILKDLGGVPRVGGGDPHELGDLVELDTCSPRRRG